MKISIQKQELHRAISMVSRATKNGNVLTESVLFNADESLAITGNNLEIGIKADCIATIYETGSICINAKLIGDLVAKMPNELIQIETDGDNINLKCGTVNVDIMGLNADGFSAIEIPDNGKTFKANADMLKSALQSILFACATSDIKPILTGVKFEGNGTLKLISCDGFRLAIMTTEIECNDIETVIPAMALNELIKIVSGNVTVSISEKLAQFEFGDTVFICRVLDGTYVNYNSIISGKTEFEIEPDISQIKASIERAMVLIGNENTPIEFHFTDSEMLIKSGNSKGKYEDRIKTEGKDGFRIGFNSNYIMQALKICDEAVLKFSTPISPCIIESGDWMSMVVPVRLK